MNLQAFSVSTTCYEKFGSLRSLVTDGGGTVGHKAARLGDRKKTTNAGKIVPGSNC